MHDGPLADVPVVLSRDCDLWAVYKPAGWAVHPAGPRAPRDVLGWAREIGAPSGLAPVHRLDAPTSGVVLFTPDRALRARIGGWFADGLVLKSYEALVFGRTRAKGTINRALLDERRHRPLPARTRYARLTWLGAFTHVKVRPETGRKHQIRRHMQGIGHPIVGDDRYRPRRFRPVPAFPGRLWLHAARVTLPDGRVLDCPLPLELAAHLAALSEPAEEAGEAEAERG